MVKPLIATIAEIFGIIVFAILFLSIMTSLLTPKDETKAFANTKQLIEYVCDPKNPAMSSKEIFLPVDNREISNDKRRYFEIFTSQDEKIKLVTRQYLLAVLITKEAMQGSLNCAETIVPNCKIKPEPGKEIFILKATRISPATSGGDKSTLLLESNQPGVVTCT